MNLRKIAGKKAKGFTLVEILVVILIIGLLFVYLVPKISSATDKARETGIKTDMHSYQVAFESVVKENSGLGANALGATGEDAAAKLADAKVKLRAAVNQYLDPALTVKTDDTTTKSDPWNKPYEITYDLTVGNDGAIAIACGGKDADVAATTIAKADIDDLAAATGDYILETSYSAGEQFTATDGFSKDIVAK